MKILKTKRSLKISNRFWTSLFILATFPSRAGLSTWSQNGLISCLKNSSNKAIWRGNRGYLYRCSAIDIIQMFPKHSQDGLDMLWCLYSNRWAVYFQNLPLLAVLLKLFRRIKTNGNHMRKLRKIRYYMVNRKGMLLWMQWEESSLLRR